MNNYIEVSFTELVYCSAKDTELLPNVSFTMVMMEIPLWRKTAEKMRQL